MYKNYFIVLELLLKNVKILYALFRAQTSITRDKIKVKEIRSSSIVRKA